MQGLLTPFREVEAQERNRRDAADCTSGGTIRPKLHRRTRGPRRASASAPNPNTSPSSSQDGHQETQSRAVRRRKWRRGRKQAKDEGIHLLNVRLFTVAHL